MSWHFSLALVEGFLEANSSDGEPCALSKLTATASTYSLPAKTKASSNLSQFGMTCSRLTAPNGGDLLTWFLGASRARTSVAPARASVSPESDRAFGARCGGLLGRYDPNTLSLKTLQCLLFEDSTECLATLPNWGLMRTGECWERTMPVLHTFENASGLWPTPCLPGNGGSHGKAKLKAMLWPTPQSHNYKEPGAGHVKRGGRRSDLTLAVKRERERELANTNSEHEQDVIKGEYDAKKRPQSEERPLGSRGDALRWWASEPELGRVAHGVANRVDRLKAIGNGQVPAVVKLAWETLKP